MKYLVHASYLEIYNEEIRDLLGKDIKRKLDLKEPVILHLPRVQPTYKKVLNPPSPHFTIIWQTKLDF